MFCRMGSLHVCRPQGRYGRGQNGPWRSCISCEWLKACVLPLFSLPRFSPECCILVAFVSLHSHLNNAFCERKIMTDYCSELTAHRRSFCNLRDVSKTNGVLSWQMYLQSPQTSRNDFSHESGVEWEMGVSCEFDGCVLSLLSLECLGILLPVSAAEAWG